MTRAVVFDLDGVLIDSEQVWDDVRRTLAEERGGSYTARSQRDMMGMSSPEWSRYMHHRVGLAEPPEEINRIVVERMRDRYADSPPWIPGALDAVARMAQAYPLGLASSSNRELIDLLLDGGRIAVLFRATVSSEEVARGKPAPDVYLEAARRLGVEPRDCVAVEDSHNGIRAAKAAGLGCIAIPNAGYPPGEAVAEADVVIADIPSLTAAVVESIPPAA